MTTEQMIREDKFMDNSKPFITFKNRMLHFDADLEYADILLQGEFRK